MDPELEQCINTILKKTADTNVFMSEAAQLCMDAICLTGNESKIIAALIPHYDNKSPALRA